MGLVLPQKVEVKWTDQMRPYYTSRGYFEDSPYFFCDVQDLSDGSIVSVDVACDFCGTIYKKPYKDVVKLRSEKYCCPSCLSHRKKCRDVDGHLIFIEAPYRNREWLKTEYIEKGRAVTDIADECGINQRTLLEWIKKFDLRKRDYKRASINTDDVVARYLSGNETTEDIGHTYGVTGNTIASILREHGVSIPTRSQLMLQYYYKKGGIEKAREIACRYENRVKSSCRQRGMSVDDFDGFSQTASHIIRNSWEYKEWRSSVFKRDGYCCVCCGRHSKRLEAHHIKNFSSFQSGRFDIDNGVTLCVECHSIAYPESFHTIYGEFDNTPEQLREYLDTYSEKRKNFYAEGA